MGWGVASQKVVLEGDVLGRALVATRPDVLRALGAIPVGAGGGGVAGAAKVVRCVAPVTYE